MNEKENAPFVIHSKALEQCLFSIIDIPCHMNLGYKSKIIVYLVKESRFFWGMIS
jgi:hypothetical protein